MYIFVKETVSYFGTHGSSVHAVFLDASKVFNRVLHMKLFEKLIQRTVPIRLHVKRRSAKTRQPVLTSLNRSVYMSEVIHVWQTRR